MMNNVFRGVALLIVLLIAACSGRGCDSQPGSATDRATTADEKAGSGKADELLQPVEIANQAFAAALGAGDRSAELTIQDLTARIEAVVAAAEAASTEIPRHTFDVSALAGQIGPNPEKLSEWVRDNTYLVPYRGVLRGSRGVLMDRLGNSLDRALLLADLLSASGSDVRLAHATLTTERASELLKSAPPMPSNRSPSRANKPQADYRDAITDFAHANGLDAVRLRKAVEQMSAAAVETSQRFRRRVETQTAQIAELVGGTPNGSAATATEDMEALRDHWWVQYNGGKGWIDLDPTVTVSTPAQPVAAAAETMAVTDIPADRYHEVTIRVVVEQMGTGALHEATVLEYGLRVHEATGQRIVLRHRSLNWPTGLDPGNAQFRATLDNLVLAQREWVPVLSVGAQTISQSSFTEAGTVKDTPSAASIYEPADTDAGIMVDAFGGGAEETPESDSGLLTAEWIEFEIIVPGRPARTIRREVFDLLGPAARYRAATVEVTFDDASRLRRGMSLLGETDILVLGCQLSGPYVEHVLNASMLDQRETMAGILQASAEQNMSRLIELSSQLDPVPVQLFGLALAREALSPVKDDVYIDSPNVLGFHRRLAPADGGLLLRSDSLDIIANDVSARRNSNPLRARLTQGVVDTAAESLFVAGCRDCGPVGNVSNIWLATREAGEEWQPVRSLEALAGGNFALSDDARYRVEQDINAGYTILLPRRPVDSASQNVMGWWRVHPVSGATLGVMESGEGQAIVEYLRQKQAIVGAGFFVFSLYDCLGEGGRGGFVKVAACLGCAASAGDGAAATLRNVGRVTLTNMTPGLAGKLLGTAAICIAASLM